jgi:hypothetical protein
MANLSVQVACTAARYWVTIDTTDMYDTDKVPADQSPQPFGAGLHHLFWWMEGASGDTISIQVIGPVGPIGSPITGQTPPLQSAAGDYATFNT